MVENLYLYVSVFMPVVSWRGPGGNYLLPLNFNLSKNFALIKKFSSKTTKFGAIIHHFNPSGGHTGAKIK